MRTFEDSAEGSERGDEGVPELRIHESAPGRVVFVEADNADGWIATDLTVDVDP